MPGGSLPNPNARRRRYNPVPAVHLPAERSGPTPQWPLEEPPSDAERRIWQDLWRLPAAVVWERQSAHRLVARYVKLAAICERPSEVKAATLAECRQAEDRLGLSPAAAARMHWTVGDGAPADVVPLPEKPRRRLIVTEEPEE
jgi:hypothetical protein